MIRFFRRIRQKLLTQNKVSKYLIYAIGEVALVVIGILIALSLNNWNEKRKSTQKEITFLKNIQSDLIESKVELKRTTRITDKTIDDLMLLIDVVVEKKKYDKSFDSALLGLLYFESPYLNYTTYESLKSSGSDLISNNELLKSINKIYEYDFKFLMDDQDRLRWEELSHIHLPFYTKNIEANINDGGGKPNDFEQLLSDPEFLNILKLKLRHSNWWQGHFSRTSNQIDHILILIENEILKLE